MWRLMLPKARHVITLAVFLLLLVALLDVVVRHSDPYEEAERFLMSDARVSAAVGPVKKIDFKFWDGFHVISSSNDGKANFTFEVSGGKGISTIEVHLRSSSGTWHVLTADVRTPGGVATRIVGRALVSTPVPLG